MCPAYSTDVRFNRAELQGFRGATVPDLIGDEVRLLLVGINPGLLSAAVQTHFATPGNRFYPALYRAGVVDRLINASTGYDPADRAHLLDRGIGISNVVPVATARADELDKQELAAGARTLVQRIQQIQPTVVAILGITAYRSAFNQPRATTGHQPVDLGGAALWVVPNPSGLNAHSSLAALAAAYRDVAIAAGIDVFDPPH